MKEHSTMNATNVVEKPRARIEEERTRRRRREDLGNVRHRNLAVDGEMDPNFVYRWINDDPGRVHALTVNDDWDAVSSGQLGSRTDKDKGVGSNVERVVEKTTGKRAILVRKLKDHYVEDKAKEQRQIDELDASIKQGRPTASPEGLSSQGANAYVPSGGIVINDGRKS